MASNLACDSDQEEHHLVFIDQINIEQNIYKDAVEHWRSSPFKTISIFPGRIKGLIKKYRSRRDIFKSLKCLIESIKPDEIRVGNDRRIEFQYSMYIASQVNPNVIGGYLDEGTYTYIGREASSSFGDNYLDNIVKKMSYGWWWDNPATIGGSKWISNAYVAFPDLVHEKLTSKNLVKVNAKSFRSNALNELSTILCDSAGLDSQSLVNLDVLISLPFESIYLKSAGYKSCILDLAKSLYDAGLVVGIKYHPRDSQKDGLGLIESGYVKEVASKVNFESLITKLTNCVLVGDVSSVLLISRWLRPDLPVCALNDDSNNSGVSQFNRLYDNLNIPIVRAEVATSEIIKLARYSE